MKFDILKPMRFMGFFSAAIIILTLSLSFGGAVLAEELSPAEKARLQAELARVEAEIAAQTKLLQSKQKETASIQRDIDILTVKINRAKLNIQAKTLEIKRLGTDIGKKEATIRVLTQKGEKQLASLSELLRQTRDMDDISVTEVALSSRDMSDLFNDVDSYQSVQNSLYSSFNQVRDTKDKTSKEKTSLEVRRNAELDARQIIEAEKKDIEKNDAEKKRLLALSKNQENSYKTVIANREAERQKILSALFKLRDASNINFGQALQYANTVSKATGVRAAFILAIITQESNLGQNVGTCNRAGDPPEKHWTQIMKPTRDIEPFKRITASLGISPEGQPLSCPIGGGWGGAMGPAQFIPSTWELYQDRISKATGNNPASPWRPVDAFAASATYLADLGASGGNYSAEHTAAARYYAGSNWATAGQGYANSVMRYATQYQDQINTLQSQ
jgi:membrane-bound lytic murein transglycosylase B